MIHVVALSTLEESQSDSACTVPEAGGLGIKVFLDSNGFMVSKAEALAVMFGKVFEKSVLRQSFHETD